MDIKKYKDRLISLGQEVTDNEEEEEEEEEEWFLKKSFKLI